MTAFIIKSTISMILLFGLYRALLGKEKLFIFNRFFLICAITFSLVVPFVSIPFPFIHENQAEEIISILASKPEKSPAVANIKTSKTEEPVSINRAVEEPAASEPITKRSNSPGQLLLSIYLAGLGMMLFRFCRNIFVVVRLYRNSDKIDNDWYRIALLDHPVNPFSFLRTVYINKDDYLNKRIAENVFRHELEHIRQLHSHDIIFFEIVHIIFWFNPVLLLYKKAARINHEYLADEAVTSNIPDIRSYAYELINFIGYRGNVPFTSGFSPSMIRLRLLMLNTSTSKRDKNLRVFVSLLTTILLFLFVCFKPVYSDNQRRNRDQVTGNDNIVIEEIFFRGPDFNPLRTQVVLNGRKLNSGDTLKVDPQQIKYIAVLKDRSEIRKYGKDARDGVIEISTYGDLKKVTPDSVFFRQIFTVNDMLPEEIIDIPVSNLYSSSIWTYPLFPNQNTEKQWRTISIMTRDYYRISGIVVQTNGEPLSGAYLTSDDHRSGVSTDSEGRFLLEEIKPGVTVRLDAAGYEPLSFKASGETFTRELRISPEGKNESELNNISLSPMVNDFSGSWRFNAERSRTFLPSEYEMIYNIKQYDADSLLIHTVRSPGKDQEFKGRESIVFNNTKVERSDRGIKFIMKCTVSSGGRSFSVTEEVKHLLWEYRSSKRVTNYSLSEDGGRLFIQTNYYSDGNYPVKNSREGEEIEMLVFERL